MGVKRLSEEHGSSPDYSKHRRQAAAAQTLLSRFLIGHTIPFSSLLVSIPVLIPYPQPTSPRPPPSLLSSAGGGCGSGAGSGRKASLLGTMENTLSASIIIISNGTHPYGMRDPHVFLCVPSLPHLHTHPQRHKAGIRAAESNVSVELTGRDQE